MAADGHRCRVLAGQPVGLRRRCEPRDGRRPWAAVVAMIVGIGVVANEAIVWSAARDLRVSVATGQGAEMQAHWQRYEDLSRRSLLGIGLVGVRSPLRNACSRRPTA